MKLLHFILRTFSVKLFIAIMSSMVSGISMAALIALLSRQLTNRTPLTGEIVILFCTVTLFAIGMDLASKWLLTSALGWTGYQLRMALVRQVLAKPYVQLETMGTARLQAVFLEHTQYILTALHQIPNLAVAWTTLLGSLLYLGWLAPSMLGILLLLAIPMLGGHWLLRRKAAAAMKVVLNARNQAYQYYRALIEGVKELKIHSSRRHAFYTQLLQPAAALAQQQGIAARSWHHMANTWSQSTYFVFILGVLGVAAWQPAHNEVIATYALIILYMKSAVNTLLNSAVQWHEADMACRHLETMGFVLSMHADPLAPPAPLPATTDPFQLELHDVVYHYEDSTEEQSFTLGPITLALHPGEVLFLTGGNGSGKTTLIKLLTGLYTPHAGTITWNGEPVSPQTLERYQPLFSVIFADFYLFDQLLGLDVLDQHTRYYLNKFHLQYKVSVRDGVLSTIDLSHGQRKRLALLTAYLENRPIYIFDEWAAGQDPEFRAIFYHQLLPELKARGKIVIVSSHDDAYYATADRIVRLDYGQIVADGQHNRERETSHQVPAFSL